MKKWFVPGVLAAALAVAVIGGAFAAAGGFDDDDGARVAAEDDSGDAVKCAAGATDCEEAGGDDLFGICLSEDDPNYNPDEPCNDMGEEGDGAGLNMCAPGVSDCVDTVVDGDAIDGICIEGSEDCIDTPGDGGGEDACGPDNPADCAVRVNEIVIVDMETNIGSVASIVSSEYVEWPNSCLGAETEGVVCAEVITPGFKIIAEAGGQQVEYHTDLKGGFVIAS
jgi:hypothetical protein